MKLYFKHVLMHIRSQLEYRASFFLLMAVQVMTPFTSFLGIFFLFDRFGNIRGYTFGQIMLCFGVTYCAYAIAEAFTRGYDSFASLIRTGKFDRLMLQPRPIGLLVLCSAFEMNRVGKLCFAFILLILGAFYSGIVWTFIKILVLIAMVLGGAMMFSGVWMAFAVICFFTIEGVEVTNIFADGGRELSSYPLDIYAKPVQKFFTFVIPFGMMNYIPLKFLMDQASPICALAPLAGLLFLIIAQLIFNLGVKKYVSTGS